jgi:single-strand DNA-binding protein
VNLWIGTGRLTSDPEIRYVQTGDKTSPKATFSVAINEGHGEKQHTEYVDCFAWDRLAETIGEYARKGRLVLVSGQLRRESYVKDGKTLHKTRVRAVSCEFLDRPTTNTSPAPGAAEDDLVDLSF